MLRQYCLAELPTRDGAGTLVSMLINGTQHSSVAAQVKLLLPLFLFMNFTNASAFLFRAFADDTNIPFITVDNSNIPPQAGTDMCLVVVCKAIYFIKVGLWIFSSNFVVGGQNKYKWLKTNYFLFLKSQKVDVCRPKKINK